MGINAPIWMKTTHSARFSSISDLNLLSKLIRTGGPWVRIPLIPKIFQISSFLSKNSFYYFYNISYAQINIFLLKCIVSVPKVRFRPIVYRESSFNAISDYTSFWNGVEKLLRYFYAHNQRIIMKLMNFYKLDFLAQVAL